MLDTFIGAKFTSEMYRNTLGDRPIQPMQDAWSSGVITNSYAQIAIGRDIHIATGMHEIEEMNREQRRRRNGNG